MIFSLTLEKKFCIYAGHVISSMSYIIIVIIKSPTEVAITSRLLFILRCIQSHRPGGKKDKPFGPLES